jgi:hypothetical protein
MAGLIDPNLLQAAFASGLLAPPAPQMMGPAQQDVSRSRDGSSGGFLSGLLGGADNMANAFGGYNRLMELGLGMASGNTVGEGLRGGLSAIQNSRKQNETVQALIKRGLDPQTAAAAVSNPELLKVILPTLFSKKEAWSNGQHFGNFDPVTGRVNPQGAAPRIDNIPEGASVAAVTPPPIGRPSPPLGPMPPQTDPTMTIPQSQVAQANAPPQNPNVQILQQSQRKPPEGFRYSNPNDPNAGVEPIPGGPATQVSAEIAGRLAMMDVASSQIDRASKDLLVARGSWGYGLNPLTEEGRKGLAARAMSATNIGPLGQANRSVQYGVEAALRAMTGAAAPDKELVRYNTELFSPTSNDSPETVQQKLGSLKAFMDRARGYALQGRTPTVNDMRGSLADPLPRKDQERAPALPPGADPLGIRR